MSFAGGELLRESGFGAWEIQNAETRDRALRHDWLVQGNLYVDLTAHQFEPFDAYLLGFGASPVTELYPIMRGRYPTRGISSRPRIVEYKERLSKMLGRARSF